MSGLPQKCNQSKEMVAMEIESFRYPEVSPSQYWPEEDELARNASRRVPVVICIDCSFSMRQENRLEKVMDGVRGFVDDMARDNLARDSVEVCIISYGGDQATMPMRFTTPDKARIPKLTAYGRTPLAGAVHLALLALEEQKERYEDNGISFYRPMLILIGDGNEALSSRQLRAEAARLKEESDAKHLNVLCIIVGDEDKIRNKSTSLMQLAPDGRVHYLRDLKFHEFFGWLSRSIQKTSQSMSGEEVYYEPTGNWAQVITQKGTAR